MTAQAVEVRHDHGITREVHEVYRRYADTVQRLRTIGTVEDNISEDFYLSALKLYAEVLLVPDALAQLTDEDRRDTLCSLATIALRWARKVRIGAAPEVHTVTMREDGGPDDT